MQNIPTYNYHNAVFTINSTKAFLKYFPVSNCKEEKCLIKVGL